MKNNYKYICVRKVKLIVIHSCGGNRMKDVFRKYHTKLRVVLSVPATSVLSERVLNYLNYADTLLNELRNIWFCGFVDIVIFLDKKKAEFIQNQRLLLNE
jgi:hypothetical protein